MGGQACCQRQGGGASCIECGRPAGSPWKVGYQCGEPLGAKSSCISAVSLWMAAALAPHGYRSCHAGHENCCVQHLRGKDSTRRRFRAAAVLPTRHFGQRRQTASDNRGEVTSGPFDHRKAKSLIDDARSLIARRRMGRRELTESW